MQSWPPNPGHSSGFHLYSHRPAGGDCGQRLWFFTHRQSDCSSVFYTPELCLQYFVPLFTILHGLPRRSEELHVFAVRHHLDTPHCQAPGGPARGPSVSLCASVRVWHRVRSAKEHTARGRGPWSAGGSSPSSPRAAHLRVLPALLQASDSGVNVFSLK